MNEEQDSEQIKETADRLTHLLSYTGLSPQEQISSLQACIWQKEQDERKRIADEILPFLRQHAKLVWNNQTSLEVEFLSDDKRNEAIRLLEKATGDAGFNHYGCEVAENVRFHYDDESITLTMSINGRTKEYAVKKIEKCLQLGIPVSFESALRESECSLKKAQAEVLALESLQRLYDQRSDINLSK
jgi:hypothetical protein